MFKHCIIHIGTEKTGTSSIQATLKANAGAWSKKGILIPTTFGAGSDRDFANYSIDDGRYDDGRRRRGITTQEHLDSFRGEIEAKLSQIAAAPEHDTFVISSEHLQSRLTTEASVERLHALLRPYCESFSVICLLRPQHEVAISLYSTAMRVGHPEFDLIPQAKESDLYYNYDRLLDRWAAVFGRDSIIPHIYSAEDSVSDFLALAKLPAPVNRPPKGNTRLSGRAQAFLKEMNGLLPKDARGNLGELVPSNDDSSPALPSRHDAERFFNIFQGPNEQVRRKWFAERPTLFAPDFSRYPMSATSPRLSTEDAFRIFAELWRKKQAQVSHLQRRVRQGGR